MVRATSEMRLDALGACATRVRYWSEVEISGRLGRYGAGMMKKLAERKAAEFETAFLARFAGSEAGRENGAEEGAR
jgi:carbon monoxide dehydrogenase subunit G